MSADADRSPQGNGAPPITLREVLRVLGSGTLFVVLLGMCVISPSAVEQLLLGWLYFPISVVPKMSVNGPSVVLGSVATIAFVIGLHATLRWFMGNVRLGASLSQGGWRFRLTFACASMLLLMFAAGTAMVGATHQAIWLNSGRADRERDTQVVRGMLGGIRNARQNAMDSEWRNKLKQAGPAVHNFHDTFGSFPAGGTLDENGRLMHGWAIYLGNYMTYSNAGIDFSVPWNEPPNDSHYRCALPEYLSPFSGEIFDEDGYGLSHVAGNVHVLPLAQNRREILKSGGIPDEGWTNGAPRRLTDIRDGTGSTLLIGEVAENFKPWGHPANVRDPSLGIGRSAEGFNGPPGADGAQFLMCDGSVRLVSARTDLKVMRALATPDGGEDVSDAE